MHVGRHHESAQHAIHRRRQPKIGMVEHRAGIEQHFEDHHGDRRAPERHDEGELVEHGQEDLEGMEAHARGHVEIEIRVVHAVQSPEHRDGMEQHMLQVDRQIEHRD